MSGSVWVLLVTVGVVAYATAAVLRSGIGWNAKLPAVVLYALLGIHTVLLAWWFGDGRLLPGYQLNPEIRNFYRAQVEAGAWPAPHPGLSFFALLAHLLVLVPRPGGRNLLLLAPATLFFAWVFFHYQQRAHEPPTAYERAPGPVQHAYLTLTPDHTLVFAAAEPDALLARVLHVHAARSRPPSPRLFWTRDGHVVVFATRRRRLFAVDRDGATVGALPVESHEWPASAPGVQSTEVRRRFSQAARDVAAYIEQHGGIYVE